MFISVNLVSTSYYPCLQVEEHGIAVCCPCHMMEECLRKLMKFFGAIEDEFGHFSGRVIKNQNMAVPTSQLRDLAVQNTAAPPEHRLSPEVTQSHLHLVQFLQ